MTILIADIYWPWPTNYPQRSAKKLLAVKKYTNSILLQNSICLVACPYDKKKHPMFTICFCSSFLSFGLIQNGLSHLVIGISSNFLPTELDKRLEFQCILAVSFIILYSNILKFRQEIQSIIWRV
jgi:hypothetical protein